MYVLADCYYGLLGSGGGGKLLKTPPPKKGGWGVAVKDIIQPAEKKSEKEKEKKSKMSTFKNIFFVSYD